MEFRAMRRSAQQLSQEECERILERNTSGVLAVMGDGGYPYAVPLSYVYVDGSLYFHCAKSGHKLDAIRGCSRVSFCVTDQDEIVPEKYTTCFRSVIVFGRARILEDEAEIRRSIEALARKYAPGDTEENRTKEIEREWAALCMIQVEIKHMTGKEAHELMRRRQRKTAEL